MGSEARLFYVDETEFERVGKEIYSQIRETGRCSVEIPIVRKDGSEIFVLFNGSPLSDADGSRAITASVLDITALKRTGRELRAHRDRLGEMVRERTAELTDSNAELQRMIEDAESRSVQAAVLNEMGELLQACETEEETYRVACGVCAKLFPDDCGCIGILEEDNWCIRIVGSWGDNHCCTAEFAHNDCWAIRRGIERDVTVVHDGDRLQITASLGVAAFPVHGEDVEALLAAADAALYRAKEGGRNRVVGFD